MACWDIETWTLPDGQLRDLMIVLAYESRVSGTFHEVTFTHTGFQFPLSDTIRKHTYTSDYLPPEVGIVFDASNLLKPRRKRKKTPTLTSRRGATAAGFGPLARRLRPPRGAS